MSRRHATSADVAIVGLACTYAGARTAEQFWGNIVTKVDALHDVPVDRFDPEVFYDPRPGIEDKIYCKRGGFLGSSFAFNPLKYGTMPRTVDGAEPDQFLVLRTVYEAMEDAGCLDGDIEGERVSFILGRGNYLGAGLAALLQRGQITQQVLEIIKGLHPEFTPEQLDAIKTSMRRSLPGFSAETAPGLIPNITTGRVANRLDFMGKNFTIDAACASSLIAVELGIQELVSGRNDLVLAGGVHVFTNIPFLQVFTAMRALSPTATIRPFDADCDGTMAGEGVGILVLKRLEDAERDGDRIYAVVKGVGSSSDGRAKSVTAPRVEGEELALRRAYEAAGVAPQSVGLIEAHGTGTMVGDQAEATTLRRVFGEVEARPTCAVGSVKSMIGHAMPAAGAAGLIKTALALYHRVLPPTLNCRKPLAELVDGNSPFYVNSELRPWIHGDTANPRRAGVNAFGFGGVNAHVVLEEYTGDDPASRTTWIREWESELFVLEAASRAALRETAITLRRYLAAVSGIALRDVAASLNGRLAGDRGGPAGRGSTARVSIVASSFDDLARKLDRVVERLAEPNRTQIKDAAGIYYFENESLRGGKVAVLFPGEGSQYVNMLADLCVHFPEVRECFDRADGVLTDRQAREVPSADIFPPPFFSPEAESQADLRLWDMQRATEAVLTADGAMFTLMQRFGLQGDMLAGHSAGEWVALAASGILDIDEFLGSMDRLAGMYRRLKQDASIPKMVMLAVGAGRDRVADLVREIDATVHLANDNCPHQVVVVADPADADRVVTHIQARGVFVERLPYDRGYHTPAFTYICDPLREYFSALAIRPPRALVYCSTTAAPFPADTGEILEHVAQTFARPLQFRQTIEAMYAAGARIFVEVGPRGGLTAFVDDILRGQPHVAVATDQQRRPALTTLHHALGMLTALHVPLDLGLLYARRSPRVLTWDAAADSVPDVDAAPGTMAVKLGTPRLEPPPPVEPPVTAAVPPVVPTPAVDATPMSSLLPAALQVAGAPALVPDPPPAAAAWLAPANGNGHGASPPAAVAYAATVHADGGAAPLAAGLLNEHFAFMEDLLETQEAVMRAYFARAAALPMAGGVNRGVAAAGNGGRAVNPIIEAAAAVAFEAAAAPPIAVAEVPAAIVVPAEMAVAARAVPEPPLSAAPLQVIARVEAPADITSALLTIVSERTGYPTEMLGLDLDMEADLGIDSIKRIEILSALQQMSAGGDLGGESAMEDVAKLKTLREVIAYLERRAPAPGGVTVVPAARNDAAAPNQPLIGNRRVVSHVAGEETLLLCDIDVQEHRYLLDHCFDTVGSEWDLERTGLAFVPFTVSLEMMAEVAATLVPGRHVIGAKNAQALRWIDVDPDGELVTLALQAKRTGPDSVRVLVWKQRPDAAPGTRGDTLADGLFLVGDEFPQAPAAEPLELVNGRPMRYTAPELYAQRRLFHGPRFQGVVSADGIGENGVVAQLEVLPTDDVIASTTHPVFHIDPFLLDAAGQLVGYWPIEYCTEGFVLFPIGIKELTLYGPPRPVGDRTECRVRITNLTPRQLRADIDVLAADGSLWMRVTGWEDWRFAWQADFYEFWRFPNRRPNGVALDVPLPAGAPEITCRRVQPFGESDKSMWEYLWAHMVLSRREMATYRNLPDRASRSAYLYPLAVAKDAVRVWIEQHHRRSFYPADIEVIDEEGSALRLAGPAAAVFPVPMHVSVSYDAPVAVAAAGPTPVGIEIEAIVHWEGGAEDGRVRPVERGLLPIDADSVDSRDEWLTRAWCAKKAAAKARGLDIRDAQHYAALTITGAADTGAIALAWGGAQQSTGAVTVSTAREGDYIVALAIGVETR